jgi:predicted phage terminase large subunit-like protein
VKLKRFTDLSPEKQKRLRELLTPRITPFFAHSPTARQHAALLLDQKREVLYGGAAGGGKSDFLLMAALQYADVPGYAALILRRTFSQLSKADGLLLRTQEWPAGKAQGAETVGGTPTKWIFPSGARLEFGHCQHERDRFDYQSAAYQFIGFDELTQFTESIYRYIGLSRLRRLEGVEIPLRVRSASNPGGIGHDWVKARFITSRDASRAFLPAKLSDNPYLDGEEYEQTLMELHPYERDQLLKGDWDARPPGALFKREWFEVLPVRPGDVPRWVRYWDLAATAAGNGSSDPDWTVGTLMGRQGSRYIIADVQRFRASPQGVDARIKQTAEIDGTSVPIWIEQEPGASGKFAIDHFVRMLPGWQVRGERPTGDKVQRAGPFASYSEAGNVLLVAGPWVEEWLRELEMFGPDCAHDDQTDSGSGAFKKLHGPGGVSPEDALAFMRGEEAQA